MLRAIHKNKFEKDIKRLIKRGYDLEKLCSVIEDLVNEKPLSKKLRDHSLKGEYDDCRECHIEPDWLLIYLLAKPDIIFIRTGTHSDLFG